MSSEDRSRTLALGNGGWIFALGGLAIAAVVVWRVALLLGDASRPVGDGSDPVTYGFDLEQTLVPVERILASGIPRDGMPALNNPPTMTAVQVDEFNAVRRGKYLVSTDRVIGLQIGGETRAYPIRVLNWHELVNDYLGDVPVAISFSPLCDSAVVFDRRIGERTLELGVSGLLYNSNLLMYDRQDEPEASSLWSQLQARAISGDAGRRGERLEILPASFTTWGRWRERHPETTVLRPDPARIERYKRDPYGSYLSKGVPRYPVEPSPPADGPDPMTPVLVYEGQAGRTLYPLEPERMSKLALSAMLRGVKIDFDQSIASPSVIVRPRPKTGTIYSRWFAWYAQHPETPAKPGS